MDCPLLFKWYPTREPPEAVKRVRRLLNRSYLKLGLVPSTKARQLSRMVSTSSTPTTRETLSYSGCSSVTKMRWIRLAGSLKWIITSSSSAQSDSCTNVSSQALSLGTIRSQTPVVSEYGLLPSNTQLALTNLAPLSTHL